MSSFKDNSIYKKTSFLTGVNSNYIEEYYALYLQNPKLLTNDWIEFFDGLKIQMDLRNEANHILEFHDIHDDRLFLIPQVVQYKEVFRPRRSTPIVEPAPVQAVCKAQLYAEVYILIRL